MKKILTLIACCMMGMNLSAQTANEDSLTADTTLHQVMLETTMGNIKLALYNDTPKHRDNFLKLVNEGYYNGCIFQRVIKNFMIQGGDYSCRKVTPGKVEKFDVGYTVPAEIIYLSIITREGSCAWRVRVMTRTLRRHRELPISTSPGAETFRLDRWNTW